MRSLHIITSTARRGAETFAVELAAALSSMGEDAAVVALARGTDAGFDLPWLGTSRRSPPTLAKLRRYARSADLVVAHGSSTLEACAMALAGSRAPFVYRSIGDPSYWVDAGRKRRSLGFLHRRAARHVALWPGAAEQLVQLYGVARERIDVIPNAVGGERWPVGGIQERSAAKIRFGVDMGQPCLAFVGALSPEKDVDAVLAVARVMPDACVLIAGDGTERARLELSAAASCPGRVRFLGSIADPRPVYLAADLLLLPSLSEGMPGVVIEAGLVGTASVVSAVGAVPEMIDHGLTGWLTRPNDHAEVITTVQDALPHAAIRGLAAADDFRSRFTMPKVANRWLQTLDAARG
ncbi:MAG: glycosyltransferase [Dehalococcoidia bacterium]